MIRESMRRKTSACDEKGSNVIIAHYANRPPKNYDLGFIRALTKERAPIWNARPELYFKALMLREAGSFGAIANSFSSLYLWRQDSAYRDWLVSGGYSIVTDPFGRAEIETRFALDARKGPAHEARFDTWKMSTSSSMRT
jgi:hypothetical protein